VLKISDSFVDGDGVGKSADAIVRRFNRNESATTVGARPLRAGDLPEAPLDEGLAQEISRLLPVPTGSASLHS
jgi:hypothetical protein